MSDEKKKHIASFGKGRKRRRLQLRQAWTGQLATVAVAAPPVGSDSESDANDSDSCYSPVTSQVLFFLHLADQILSRVHVFIYYIIIGGNQHAGLAAYVPCNKNTVISSEVSMTMTMLGGAMAAAPMAVPVVNGPGLASLLKLELYFVICATAWFWY